MSDESSRSARPSGQRRNDGAPVWWSALERVDLPEDPAVPAAHRRWYEESASMAAVPPPPRAEVAGGDAPHRIRPAWIVNTLVAMVVLMVLMVALGVVDSPWDALTLTMLIVVPLVLVVITTLVVARRSR
jgi:hypothetical protein